MVSEGLLTGEKVKHSGHRWGSEFSSNEIKLRNRVTQNVVTLWIINLKSKNKKLHFELLTRRPKIKIYTLSY